MKKEEEQFNNAQKNDKAIANAQKLEQTKRAQRRQEIQAKRKIDNKNQVTNERSNALQHEVGRQVAYKTEAARLRAEEQQEARENLAYQKELRKYQILEKHLNMQQKLDCKQWPQQLSSSLLTSFVFLYQTKSKPLAHHLKLLSRMVCSARLLAKRRRKSVSFSRSLLRKQLPKRLRSQKSKRLNHLSEIDDPAQSD